MDFSGYPTTGSKAIRISVKWWVQNSMTYFLNRIASKKLLLVMILPLGFSEF